MKTMFETSVTENECYGEKTKNKREEERESRKAVLWVGEQSRFKC